MDNILIFASIAFFFWVMFYRKISPVSLFGIFALQWFFYWIAAYLTVNKLMPRFLPQYVHDREAMYYFIVFNAIYLIIFSLVYLFFYRQKEEIIPGQDPLPGKGTTQIFSAPLFFVLLAMNAVLIILSIKFPYLKYNWITHSINSNLRNAFVALFFLYMLVERDRKKAYLNVVLFALSTIIWGGRLFMAILMAGFVFYYYNIKVFRPKQLIAIFLVAITFFSMTAILRSKFYTLDKVAYYFAWPFVIESVFSSYPGIAVIKMWQNNEIKYYNFFGSYIVDPIMIFVPQFIFVKEDVNKVGYNILGKWEADHGGRGKISPQGAYYYIAEAMEAAGAWGVLIIAAAYGLICVWMEKNRYGNLLAQYTYYNFVGTFGFGYVKNQFAWCFRYFVQNMLIAVLFLLVFTVFWGGAKRLKNAGRRAS